MNWYRYANGDPVNFVDVGGRTPAHVLFLLVLAVSYALTVPNHEAESAPAMLAPFVGEGLAKLAGAGIGAMCGRGVATAGEVAASQSLPPLVYGPSAGGQLAALASEVGGTTLTSFPKPIPLSWIQHSVATLNSHVASGGTVLFDLTHMGGRAGVEAALAGTGEFAATVTSQELRYIAQHWNRFQGAVTFIRDGVVVPASQVIR